MNDPTLLPTIRMNGKDPVGRAAEASALGRADRLANVGQLAAGLAHEMNTPLGSISAHAEESLELLEHLDVGRIERSKVDDVRGRLMAIMRQANRCSRIATRLLQFAQPARPVGGKCRPAEVVAEVVKLFTPTARAKGVHLDRVADKDLPETPVAAAEFEQLLVNLVQNSLDACSGGEIIRVQATVREDGTTRLRSLDLIVTDTGSGIPRDVLNRIFDPFFTTKSVGQGTGLGLSVCHGIVRSVGGSIAVESAPGQGTRVTVSLPVESDARLGIQVHEACPLGTGHCGNSGRKETGGMP